MGETAEALIAKFLDAIGEDGIAAEDEEGEFEAPPDQKNESENVLGDWEGEGEGDFAAGLDPGTIASLDTTTLTDILNRAATKYPFMRNSLLGDPEIISRLFWTVYLTCTDPTLSHLTQTSHPEFHFWLTHFFAAFLATRHRYGLDVFEFVADVYAFVQQEVYLPRSGNPGEP
jgi:hypothetical protein